MPALRRQRRPYTEQLAEPPTLRFLAWQDEWKTNQPGAARHPDGSPVTDPTELDWLRQIQPVGMDVSSLQLKPEPRFLHLWISHPAFDPNSFNEIALLDGAGKPIQLGGGASMSSAIRSPMTAMATLAGSRQP